MPTQAQQRPATRLLIIMCIIWMLFPDNEYQPQSSLLSDKATVRLEQFRHSLDVLRETHWGDFAPEAKGGGKYLNLTGFRKEDGYAWEGLRHFLHRGLELSHYANPSIGGQELWDLGEGEPVWSLASGTVHGEWVRKNGSVWRGHDSYNLSRSVPPYNWEDDRIGWNRNLTGNSGRIMLQLDGNETVTKYQQLSNEHKPLGGGLIRNVKGTVTLEASSDSERGWEMRLWGVHWPKQGVILLTTTSEKFDGIFGLPHLMPSPDYFQSSQFLLNQTLARTISKKEEDVFVDATVPWSSEAYEPTHTGYPIRHCEYVIYLQLHPVTYGAPLSEDPSRERQRLANWVSAIESELEHPLGAPISHIPVLQMSAIVYSPDCSFFLETKGPPEFPPGEAYHLVGLKKEIHIYRVQSWLLIHALVVFGQLGLLRNQLRESSTPSTTARVSFGTMVIMVLVDGMTFMGAATWISSAAATFLPTLVLMFASFMSTTIGGIFLAKIHEVQLPEARPRRERSQRVTNSTGNASESRIQPQATAGNSNEDLLPAPVTAGRPAQASNEPVIVPSDQDVDAEIAEVANAASAIPRPQGQAQTDGRSRPQPFQNVMGKFVLFGMFISFLAISSGTWSPSLRSGFLNMCAFGYLSLWIPQIWRNVMRNCRRSLRWQFVGGQSLLRILSIAYFWLHEDNFLYARTEPRAFGILCLWLWLQILLLAAQNVVGPRFGIPPQWLPEAWDYHPILREDNLEAGGLPIGLVPEESSDARRSKERKRPSDMVNTIDCSICHEALEVTVVKKGSDAASSVTAALARRMYMVTPCRHIFHTACLEGWMRFRLQCPICREELPPL